MLQYNNLSNKKTKIKTVDPLARACSQTDEDTLKPYESAWYLLNILCNNNIVIYCIAWVLGNTLFAFVP